MSGTNLSLSPSINMAKDYLGLMDAESTQQKQIGFTSWFDYMDEQYKLIVEGILGDNARTRLIIILDRGILDNTTGCMNGKAGLLVCYKYFDKCLAAFL